LLAHGRWFSAGTPASSTTKTGRHILLKVALKHQKSNHIRGTAEGLVRNADTHKNIVTTYFCADLIGILSILNLVNVCKNMPFCIGTSES